MGQDPPTLPMLPQTQHLRQDRALASQTEAREMQQGRGIHGPVGLSTSKPAAVQLRCDCCLVLAVTTTLCCSCKRNREI